MHRKTHSVSKTYKGNTFLFFFCSLLENCWSQLLKRMESFLDILFIGVKVGYLINIQGVDRDHKVNSITYIHNWPLQPFSQDC